MWFPSRCVSAHVLTADEDRPCSAECARLRYRRLCCSVLYAKAATLAAHAPTRCAAHTPMRPPTPAQPMSPIAPMQARQSRDYVLWCRRLGRPLSGRYGRDVERRDEQPTAQQDAPDDSNTTVVSAAQIADATGEIGGADVTPDATVTSERASQ